MLGNVLKDIILGDSKKKDGLSSIVLLGGKDDTVVEGGRETRAIDGGGGIETAMGGEFCLGGEGRDVSVVLGEVVEERTLCDESLEDVGRDIDQDDETVLTDERKSVCNRCRLVIKGGSLLLGSRKITDGAIGVVVLEEDLRRRGREESMIVHPRIVGKLVEIVADRIGEENDTTLTL